MEPEDRPVKVAVIGGGCGSIATALELSRPEHKGRFEVTVYQLGWRLGGKGASGRGPGDRIEEHGLHIWLGCYENSFRMLRDCYEELALDPSPRRFAHWRDAFFPDPWVGVADRSPRGEWLRMGAHFPGIPGEPGDPIEDGTHPFSMGNYMRHCAELVRTLLVSITEHKAPVASPPEEPAKKDEDQAGFESTLSNLLEGVGRVLRLGRLATFSALLEATGLLNAYVRALPTLPVDALTRLLDVISSNARILLKDEIREDDEVRRLWEIVDLLLAIMRGSVRHGLLTDPRGFDAINDYECRDWLRENGASEASLDSAIMQGLYDLAFAYEDGDVNRPSLAAGQAVRGALRMFFTYRGSLFWKMRGGMGDVVFTPFYEVLKKRGVRFEFFHRLENVKIAAAESLSPGEKPYVEALEFDVQAHVQGGREYAPLIDVKGAACWPSIPLHNQLVDGERFPAEGWDFESHWDRRRVGSKTLKVSEDFDCVVLGVSVGAIPFVCSELVERDPRWSAMVKNTKTVATQAFQIWMNEDMEQLGWDGPHGTLSGFVRPFDSWADMRQLIEEENVAETKAIAYFCSTLPTGLHQPGREASGYPEEARSVVRENAVRFLNRDVGELWPGAASEEEGFRWELLVDGQSDPAAGEAPSGEERFDTQYWTANVNPSDRYVLCVPGSVQYRISPLDNTYDNLTVAGDWTDCGITEGCVEAAVMSGRLAAHAVSGAPRLEEIVGYDHP